MGYSAYVPCNCYSDGKVNTKPPYEEFIIEGENGLELNLEWEGNQDKHNEFWKWRHGNVCEHNNMEYCEEGLANASGMISFRAICHKLGENNFPILNKYLPRANGGNLPAKYASQLLEELSKLKSLDTDEIIIVLKETKTDDVIFSTNYGYDSEFVFGGKTPYNCGIGNIGFYIVKKYNILGKKFKRRVWVSKSFTQEKDKTGKFYFKDKVSGKKIKLDINLIPLEKKNNHFFDFEVIEKKASVIDEYAFIIEPLVKLAKASIETGNNIYWT